MSSTIETILNRRSVRAYSEEQIKQEELDTILKSALHAPSACNAQSWHLTVIRNNKLICDLNVEAKNELLKSDNDYFKELASNENYNIFYDAPAIIVISGEKNTIAPETDCAAATENMLIAAESLNIGSCWIGLVTALFKGEKRSEFMNKLAIPEGYEPYYAITLGYKKDSNQPPQPRRENTINYID